MERIKGNVYGYGVIHEEFVEKETPRRCFRRHEITPELWEKMTAPDERRWWKARGTIFSYTPLRYGVIGFSRRRWGDDLKILDRWHVVKTGTEFEAVDRDIDEVLTACRGK